MKKTTAYCDLCEAVVYGCNSLEEKRGLSGKKRTMLHTLRTLSSFNEGSEQLDLCKVCRDNVILEWARIIVLEKDSK